MRIAMCCGALATLILGAGCRSNPAAKMESANQKTVNSEVRYRVELIPNPQLSATSREGDKSSVVYSENIAAVYVVEQGTANERRGVDAEGTTSNQSQEVWTGPGFRVESIPNPELSPTSREGDKRPVVYSKNIIAVYAVGTNGVDMAKTNASPKPED